MKEYRGGELIRIEGVNHAKLFFLFIDHFLSDRTLKDLVIVQLL